METRKYLCIDQKSFYATVECVDRGLDPMTTDLVVADPERSENTICLAVSPSLKAKGVSNRCRVKEIPKHLKYITAVPRMQLYIDCAAAIHGVFLKYIAPEDIHVYSIDESFLDVTPYLKLYKMTARELAKTIIDDVRETVGTVSTCGIGTNLYLAKIALDLHAKHAADFIAELDEDSYREKLWDHKPITDFWQIASGKAERLRNHGITTMRDIAMMKEDYLYDWFGIKSPRAILYQCQQRVNTVATYKGGSHMVAGHLREQNGKYQMILSWKGNDGKRKTKSVSTGLPVKGNKRRAEEMLKITCREFNPDNSKDNANMLVSDFLAKWLKDKASTMGASRFANYAYNVKTDITPYFETHPIMLPELSADALSAFFAYERNENKVPVQILLELHEALLVGLGYAVELGWISENPVEKVNPCENDSQLLFTQFLLDWLAMMKKSVAITTHSGYTKSIKGHIIPYFDAKHPGLKLSHVTPKHIQDYYTYEMEERRLSANTILRRQANIRKALQYAYKTGLISGNPADKIERPKAEKYTGTFYQADELNSLFHAFRNDPLELVVILATYYGLRRSEIIGLRWDAIDFEKKILTVKHTVHQANIDGKWQIVALDRTKTKSSFRTLPLVGPIENLLLKEKARQQQNRRLCGTCYCTEFSEYIFVNDIGELIKPDFVSRHFALIVQKHNLKKLRFHDLRHSCASLLFANGVSMKEIQAWLGHSTLGTTANIYTHMDEDKKLDSANAIMPVLKF